MIMSAISFIAHICVCLCILDKWLQVCIYLVFDYCRSSCKQEILIIYIYVLVEIKSQLSFYHKRSRCVVIIVSPM